MTTRRPLPSRLGALALAVLAACGPGKDDSATDGASTGSTDPATDPATDSQGSTSTPVTTDAPGTDTDPPGTATDAPTTTGAPPAGCVGADEASCLASTPAGEGVCLWADIFQAGVSGTVCRAEVVRQVCMEVSGNEGGPGCAGFFKAGSPVELLETTCGDPLSEDGWELCFAGQDPAVPECACMGDEYCPGQPDEQTCVMASNAIKTCAWADGACGAG